MKTPFEYQAPHIIEPAIAATKTIIWLHGLGANAYDFESIIPYLKSMPSFESVRFVFPQAPDRAITLNQGYVMPAWYDIYQLDKNGPQDENGVKESANYLQQLIQQQINADIPAHQIYLIGFSQGAAMVLYTSLVGNNTLGGVVDLSGYLPLMPQLIEQLQTNPDTINSTNAYWCAHGKNDVVVPIDFNIATAEFLKTLTDKVGFHTYQMGHEICQLEIDDMAQWLNQQFLLNDNK